MLLLLALVPPLALDTFAIAAALGVAGIGAGRRLSLSILFAVFEGGMPLVGLLIGAQLGDRLGSLAGFVAIAALFALGIYELAGDEADEEALANRFAGAKGLVLLGAGFAVSLDELAIGFTFGLLDVPVLPAVGAIAVQAIVVSQIGFAVGRKIEERVREGAEKLAGVILVSLATLLLGARFLGVAG